MKTDVEIAQEAKMRPIQEIAAKLGISDDELELYGKYKAKWPFPLGTASRTSRMASSFS